MAERSDSRLRHAVSPAGIDPLLQLHHEIDRLFDHMLGAPGPRGGHATTTITPPVNVSETDHEIHLDAELPGVRDEDIRVDLFGDLLTIHGEKSRGRADAKRHLAECSFGTFTRTLRLPFTPRPDEVRATFEHGVLHIVLPKPTPQAGSHRIPVHGASSERSPATATRGCFGGNAALAGHPTEATAQCGAAAAQPTSRQAHTVAPASSAST